MRRHRFASTALVLVAAASLLTACSVFETGVPRDDDGSITKATVVPTTDLLVGDCFSFVDEYPEHERVNAVPCGDDHGYLVIDQGTLSNSQIEDAGGLQNAVSAGCSETFAAFKAAATEGAEPTQEFLVSTDKVDGKTITSYSCLATDGAVQASE